MKTVVAVTQLCSGKSKMENVERCEWLIEQAAHLGAQIVGLPENFMFLGEDEHEAFEAAEALDGPTISHFQSCARRLKLWLSLGGFQERLPHEKKIANTHIMLSDEGEIKAAYRKIHLFSVTLPDNSVFDEAKSVLPGKDCKIVATPFGVFGLSICYDLRFPLLYQALRSQGAQALLIPAAFSSVTGPPHWEVLLRARAIETQSYVIAPAQSGRHNKKRSTHGHAMIVDPWGTVLAQCGLEGQLAVAEMNSALIDNLRNNMPLWRQRVLVAP